MSGFAFSHQFSQRWLATPTAIKHTIMQELADIHTLLQPETELENFSFQVDNLHEAVETLQQIEALNRAVSNSENAPFTTPAEPIEPVYVPPSTNEHDATQAAHSVYTIRDPKHALTELQVPAITADTDFAQFTAELQTNIDSYVEARTRQFAAELKAELHNWLHTTFQPATDDH